MDSNTHHHHHNQQQQQLLQENKNSGLTRYKSAPSSYFLNLINSGVYGDEEDLGTFFNPSPEMPRFMSGGSDVADEEIQQQIMYQNKNNNSVASSSNLVRQSSLPAGFFEQNNMDDGYPMMRSMDPFQSSLLPSPRIPEQDGKNTFTGGSWDESSSSSMLTDAFLNEFVESGQISSSGNQENVNDGGRIIQSTRVPTGLTHQLSLPTSSTELFVKEKLLQFQADVPVKSRAKRGCATHPRSLAERVRRTRISERIRKLQDLVPNMDSQTNTADMLDLAIDYIKELQNQVETLSEHQTKCTCQLKS